MALKRQHLREIAIDPGLAGHGLGGFGRGGDRRDRGGPSLSVGGLGGLPGVRFVTGPGIFKVSPEPDWRIKAVPVRTNQGRAAIPNPKLVSTPIPPGGIRNDVPWLPRPLPPQWVNPPKIPKTRTRSPLDMINEWIYPKEKKDMGLDLGSLIGGLGGRYIDAKYGGPARADFGIPDWLEAPNWPSSPFGGDPAPGAGPGGVPGCNDGYTGCDPYKGMVWNPRAKCGSGAWVKKRRRRKRLASASDIKDLTSLLSIFGNGKALQTWIATH